MAKRTYKGLEIQLKEQPIEPASHPLGKPSKVVDDPSVSKNGEILKEKLSI